MMNKEEFVTKIGMPISWDDWKKVEDVYMYYPGMTADWHSLKGV